MPEMGPSVRWDDTFGGTPAPAYLSFGSRTVDLLIYPTMSHLPSPNLSRRLPPSSSPRGGIGRRAWFRSMCRKVWGFESLRGHQIRKREFAKASSLFFRPRAKHLRASREGFERTRLQARPGSRDVTESLRGHQIRKREFAKASSLFFRPQEKLRAELPAPTYKPVATRESPPPGNP